MTLIPERLQSAHAAGLEKYLRTGDKHINWDGIELPALHKDGHEVPKAKSELREHTHEGRRLFTGLFRDISDQKARQRRFEAVFNNTYQFTGLLDPDGTVLEMNEAALSFGDLERDDVVGTAIWDTYWFRTRKESARNGARGSRTRQGRGPVSGRDSNSGNRQNRDHRLFDPTGHRSERGGATPHPRGERHHRPQTAQTTPAGPPSTAPTQPSKRTQRDQRVHRNPPIGGRSRRTPRVRGRNRRDLERAHRDDRNGETARRCRPRRRRETDGD